MAILAKFTSLTLEDVPTIQVIAEQSAFAWTENMLRECFLLQDHIHGIEINQQLIAYSILRSVLNEAEILMIAVDKKYQRQGYGKLLMESLLTLAPVIGMQKIYLEVRLSNAIAIQLYEKLGFEAVGVRKNYYQTETGREDAILFLKVV